MIHIYLLFLQDELYYFVTHVLRYVCWYSIVQSPASLQ